MKKPQGNRSLQQPGAGEGLQGKAGPSTARNDPRGGSFRCARDDNFGVVLAAASDFPFAPLRASAKKGRLKNVESCPSLPSFARLDSRGRLSPHEPSNFKDAVHRWGLLGFEEGWLRRGRGCRRCCVRRACRGGRGGGWPRFVVSKLGFRWIGVRSERAPAVAAPMRGGVVVLLSSA
jgi:hypothetical protein